MLCDGATFTIIDIFAFADDLVAKDYDIGTSGIRISLHRVDEFEWSGTI